MCTLNPHSACCATCRPPKECRSILKQSVPLSRILFFHRILSRRAAPSPPMRWSSTSNNAHLQRTRHGGTTMQTLVVCLREFTEQARFCRCSFRHLPATTHSGCLISTPDMPFTSPHTSRSKRINAPSGSSGNPSVVIRRTTVQGAHLGLLAPVLLRNRPRLLVFDCMCTHTVSFIPGTSAPLSTKIPGPHHPCVPSLLQ